MKVQAHLPLPVAVVASSFLKYKPGLARASASEHGLLHWHCGSTLVIASTTPAQHPTFISPTGSCIVIVVLVLVVAASEGDAASEGPGGAMLASTSTV